jgi:hypothetical protein
MPTPINLDSSGLRHSSRTEVTKRCDKVYSNTMTLTNQTAHLFLASPPRSFKSALVLFSTICSFGCGMSCMAHSLQEKVTVTSTFSKAIDSYQPGKHTLQWNNKLLFNIGPIQHCIKRDFQLQSSS